MKFSALRTLVGHLTADSEGVTWTDSELNGWLAEAEIQIVQFRPDANAVTALIPLVAGAHQAIPSTAYRLLGIVRNEAGRSIRLVEQQIKDELEPDWYAATATPIAREYIFDERTPKEFYVSPPSVGGVNIYAKLVNKLPQYNFASDPDVTVDDLYQAQLVDYAAYRCLSQSGEGTAEYAKAQSLLGSFNQAMGINAKSDAGASPKARGQRK
ncbi:hypothetical protein A9Q81_11675 [Gammaproteobacteria bacterium 42_54_T18]|nr:hypothetical protein A9Q81_11675 [Gammaproteobacteria bacterium 42_54_T18]